MFQRLFVVIAIVVGLSFFACASSQRISNPTRELYVPSNNQEYFGVNIEMPDGWVNANCVDSQTFAKDKMLVRFSFSSNDELAVSPIGTGDPLKVIGYYKNQLPGMVNLTSVNGLETALFSTTANNLYSLYFVKDGLFIVTVIAKGKGQVESSAEDLVEILSSVGNLNDFEINAEIRSKIVMFQEVNSGWGKDLSTDTQIAPSDCDL